MKLSDFQYNFPESAIAKEPPKLRGNTKLFIVYTQTGEISIAKYKDLYKFLNEGDLVVRNTTKVVKSRLLPGQVKRGSSIEETNAEIFILSSENYNYDEYIANSFNSKTSVFELKALVRLKRNKLNTLDEFIFPGKWRLKVGEEVDDIFTVFLWKESWKSGIPIKKAVKEFQQFLSSEGHVPIPPYLKRDDTSKDVERYQTVFAQEEGSVAAPTASLNFTKELILKLKKRKVDVADIILHVGLGTFAPLRFENVSENKLHEETYFVSSRAIEKVKEAKYLFKRVVAIGTTALRTLETIYQKMNELDRPISGSTEIFIYHPYEFQMANTLLTNFHLPSTSLIVLVDAFLRFKKSKLSWRQIYEFAMQKGVKLFSYGDSMLIL